MYVYMSQKSVFGSMVKKNSIVIHTKKDKIHFFRNENIIKLNIDEVSCIPPASRLEYIC